MDVRGGVMARRARAAAGNAAARVYVVQGAGHHLYLDNAPAFNSMVQRVIQRRHLES